MTPAERFERLQSEILRWNSQISLVTRVDPERTVVDLIGQCRRAWTLLVERLDSMGWPHDTCWVDIGSGSGLPGLVWAAEARAAGWPGSVVLVEPRDKRAWFLNRATRAMGLDGVVVHAARWGDQAATPGVAGSRAAVLSFKALRMGDREALAGLAADDGLGTLERVAVVRFLGMGDQDTGALLDEFGASSGDAGGGWVPDGGEFLGEDNPRLLVVFYRRT
ncbi:MAG: RsmG family class I SAM-dependent methyltransferase [Candidatus Krumholzibacteriia bacterium]